MTVCGYRITKLAVILSREINYNIMPTIFMNDIYDTIRYILLESHFCTCKDTYSVQYIQYTDKTCTKPLNE